MGRQATHRGLRHAGALARPVLRRGPARQDRRKPVRGHQAALYETDRSEIIWTDADMPRSKTATAPRSSRNAIDLAAYTGLRLGDLIRLAWSHIGEDSIVIRTGKSRQRREAIIPIYDGLRAVLDRIPKRATTVLTSARRQPWTQSGLPAPSSGQGSGQMGRARPALS